MCGVCLLMCLVIRGFLFLFVVVCCVLCCVCCYVLFVVCCSVLFVLFCVFVVHGDSCIFCFLIAVCCLLYVCCWLLRICGSLFDAFFFLYFCVCGVSGVGRLGALLVVCCML